MAEVFSPGKNDSTQVNNVIQEEYTDTISEEYSPIDTIANLISDIRGKYSTPNNISSAYCWSESTVCV